MSIDPSRPPLFVRLWLDFAACLRFLFLDQANPNDDGRETDRRPWPMIPVGLLVGMLWVGTFRATWKVFGEIGSLRLIPSLAIVVLLAVFTGRPMLRAAMRLVEDLRGVSAVHRNTPIVGQNSILLMVLVLLGHFVLILSIQELRGWWPSPDDWRSWFNWMYPRPIYRPLLLTPLWGYWGVLIALNTGRAAEDADSLTRAYGRHLSVWKLAAQSALPIFLTSVYCSRGGNFFTGPMIALILLGATILFSTIVANLRGGQSRTSALSAGLFTQMTFILLYRAFWPLIER